MYCPNCGTESVESRNYCNNCGTNLLLINKLNKLAGNVDSAQWENLKHSYALEKEWHRVLSKGLLTIGAGLIYSITIFIIGYIFKKYFNISIGKFIKDLSIFGILFLAIGSMIIAYGRIKFKSKNTDLALSELLLEECKNGNKEAEKLLSGADIVKFENYSPPSVTEGTTKELKQVRSAAKISHEFNH